MDAMVRTSTPGGNRPAGGSRGAKADPRPRAFRLVGPGDPGKGLEVPSMAKTIPILTGSFRVALAGEAERARVGTYVPIERLGTSDALGNR